MTYIDIAIQYIANDVIALFKSILEDNNISDNVKTGTNTLAHSNLYNSLKVNYSSTNAIIDLFVNDYISYIERGRDPKYTPKVPIEALRDWALSKGIDTDNNTLFAIQEGIFKTGIRPRPILYYFWEECDRLWNGDWSENIFNAITLDFEEQLNNIFK